LTSIACGADVCVHVKAGAVVPHPLQIITLAYSAETASDVVIDASQSSDPTGRPLMNAVWTADGYPVNDTGFTALINDTNMIAIV
jgi:hypothetical protein